MRDRQFALISPYILQMQISFRYAVAYQKYELNDNLFIIHIPQAHEVNQAQTYGQRKNKFKLDEEFNSENMRHPLAFYGGLGTFFIMEFHGNIKNRISYLHFGDFDYSS